jgi:chromosome partitioning protein
MSEYAQVVVLASQKGGSGKTTLAGHIAVQADLAGGGPVALVDTDPQGSLAKWWNARESASPAFAQVSVPDLTRDIDALRDGGFKLIVIDTPPAATSSIAEVITHADLVVIPTRPSPHDLRAVGATVDIVEHQHKPMLFVINAATVRARITGETAVALSQHGTVAPVTLHHRVDFAASMIDGRTVSEVDPGSRSAKEIANLWAYLSDRLSRLGTGVDAGLRFSRPSLDAGLLTPGSPDAAPRPEQDEDNADMPMPTPAPQPVAAVPMTLSPDTGVPEAVGASGEDDDAWNGRERRRIDTGVPGGANERRQPRVMFGRRRGFANEHQSDKYE